MQVDLTERRLKEMAKTIRAGLPETARPSYAQTLDLMASAFGHRSFAAMKAKLGDHTPQPTDQLPDYTVVVVDQRDGDRTYSVHQVQQSDAENAGAVTRITAVQDEFPAHPFDDETEARWEHAMQLVNPVIILAGKPAPRDTAAIWTVVMRASQGFATGYHVGYVQTDDPKRAETQAQTDLRWTFAGADGLQSHALNVETVAVIPGQLKPTEDDDETDAGKPSDPEDARDPAMPRIVLDRKSVV